MNEYTVENQNQNRAPQPSAADKQEALAHLQYALLNEEYERCGYLLQDAKDKGARPDEISTVLNASVERLSAGAPKPPAGRLRF